MRQTIFKGKRVTDEDIRRAMERFDKETRDSFNRWRTYGVEHAGKLYPPKEVLSIATGEHVGEFAGGEYANRIFRELGFTVVTIDDETRSAAPTIQEAVDTSLSLESDLEKFLVGNLAQLEPGLRLYEERGMSGQQFDTQTVGRLDILAVDQTNNFVVIELKAGEADDRVCGQVLRYMGWVKENLADQRKVRGIIVANEFSEKLKYAAKVTADVTLKKYEVSFRFADLRHSG